MLAVQFRAAAQTAHKSGITSKMNGETRQDTTEAKLYRMLAIINQHPGIRASEINRALKLKHSWKLRLALLQRSLVRKVEDGSAVRYFPVTPSRQA